MPTYYYLDKSDNIIKEFNGTIEHGYYGHLKDNMVITPDSGTIMDYPKGTIFFLENPDLGTTPGYLLLGDGNGGTVHSLSHYLSCSEETRKSSHEQNGYKFNGRPLYVLTNIVTDFSDGKLYTSYDSSDNGAFNRYEYLIINTSNVTTMEHFSTKPNVYTEVTTENGSYFTRQDVIITISKIMSDLDKWDVSNVTNMSYAFYNCYIFYYTLADWDVSNVTNMSHMFENSIFTAPEGSGQTTVSFNRPLTNWDVTSVTDMSYMFANCFSLVEVATNWDMTNVLNVSYMFLNCTLFNHFLPWDTSNITNMEGLFKGCTSFNQSINHWDMSSVLTTNSMFMNATSFDQDIDNETTVCLFNVDKMFMNATSFGSNSSINNFETGNVTSAKYFMANTTSYKNKRMTRNNILFPELKYADHMFDGSAIQILDFMGSENTLITASYMFANMTKIRFHQNHLINFLKFYSDYELPNLEDASYMFYNTELGENSSGAYNTTQKWNVSSLTNCSYMYSGVTANKNNIILTFENFSPTNMEGMFMGAKNIDITDLNWGYTVTGSLANLFKDSIIKFEDMSPLDTTGITDMSNMFNNCQLLNENSSLGKETGNYWDTSNVTNVDKMFYKCKFKTDRTTVAFSSNNAFEHDDYRRWNMDNVTSCVEMFAYSKVSPNINWDWNLPDTASRLFYGSYINPSSLNHWITSNVTDMSYMFSNTPAFNCPLTTESTPSDIPWNTSNVTNMEGMFESATNFNQDVSGLDTSSVTNMSKMFSVATYFNNGSSYETVGTNQLNWDTSNVTDMNKMFYRASSFDSPINFNTSNVTDMGYMFANAIKFHQSVSSFNTSNVTNMEFMFSLAKEFNYTLLSFDTSSVTNMRSMFASTLYFNQDLSHFDTSNVTDMKSMFEGCSNFNQNLFTQTQSVIDMSKIFKNCISFNKPINFKIDSLINCSSMCNGCSSFNSPVSFTYNVATDINPIQKMNNLFKNCVNFNQEITSILNTDPSKNSIETMFRLVSGATNFKNGDTGDGTLENKLRTWGIYQETVLTLMFENSGITHDFITNGTPTKEYFRVELEDVSEPPSHPQLPTPPTQSPAISYSTDSIGINNIVFSNLTPLDNNSILSISLNGTTITISDTNTNYEYTLHNYNNLRPDTYSADDSTEFIFTYEDSDNSITYFIILYSKSNTTSGISLESLCFGFSNNTDFSTIISASNGNDYGISGNTINNILTTIQNDSTCATQIIYRNNISTSTLTNNIKFFDTEEAELFLYSRYPLSDQIKFTKNDFTDYIPISNDNQIYIQFTKLNTLTLNNSSDTTEYTLFKTLSGYNRTLYAFYYFDSSTYYFIFITVANDTPTEVTVAHKITNIIFGKTDDDITQLDLTDESKQLIENYITLNYPTNIQYKLVKDTEISTYSDSTTDLLTQFGITIELDTEEGRDILDYTNGIISPKNPDNYSEGDIIYIDWNTYVVLIDTITETTDSNTLYHYVNNYTSYNYTPITTKITDITDLFAYSTDIPDVTNWDVSNVTSAERAFKNSNFNQDISKWNVSKITNMESMFHHATQFNQDISEWDVSNLTELSNMFNGATNFSYSLRDWKINTYNIYSMFSDTSLTHKLISTTGTPEITYFTNDKETANAIVQLSNIPRYQAYFGYAVACNDSGNTVAVTSRNYGVSVYNFTGKKFVKIGQTIMKNTNDFGYKLALDSTGTIIGITNRESNFYIYKFTRGLWSLIAEDKIVSGTTAFNMNIAMNSDASVIIAGGYTNSDFSHSGYNYKRGWINFYTFENDEITKQTSKGYNAGFGHSIDISSNSSTVIIGAINKNNLDGSAIIYDITNLSSGTVTKTQTINGPTETKSNFGRNCCINEDGTIAVISGNNYIKTYGLNDTTWEDISLDINISGSFIESMKLSKDASILAFGDRNDDEYGSNVGASYIYELNNSWDQISKITPNDVRTENDYFGRRITMNKFGTRFYFGSHNVNSNQGYMAVYNRKKKLYLQDSSIYSVSSIKSKITSNDEIINLNTSTSISTLPTLLGIPTYYFSNIILKHSRQLIASFNDINIYAKINKKFNHLFTINDDSILITDIAQETKFKNVIGSDDKLYTIEILGINPTLFSITLVNDDYTPIPEISQLWKPNNTITYSHTGYDTINTSISDDGLTIAISTSQTQLNSYGKVYIYAYNAGSWIQKGSTLEDTNSNGFGSAISLSKDGTTIAILTFDYNNSGFGSVSVYQWENDDWNIKGQIVDGLTQFDSQAISNKAISINNDGTMFVVASKTNLRLYQYVNENWDRKINNSNTSIIRDVYIDNNGNITWSLPDENYTDDNNTLSGYGKVRFRNWDGSSSTVNMSSLIGNETNAKYGESIVFNSDGSIIAIGAPRKNDDFSGVAQNDGDSDIGHVTIYEKINSQWIQKGSILTGEVTGDYFGSSISLSSDGTIIAISATCDTSQTNAPGYIHVYQWNNIDWVHKITINGTGNSQKFGQSISLNSDGTTLAVSNPGQTSDQPFVNFYNLQYQLTLDDTTDVFLNRKGDHIDVNTNIINLGQNTTITELPSIGYRNYYYTPIKFTTSLQTIVDFDGITLQGKTNINNGTTTYQLTDSLETYSSNVNINTVDLPYTIETEVLGTSGNYYNIILDSVGSQGVSVEGTTPPEEIPCFTDSCFILTPQGYKNISALTVGTIVYTSDKRTVPITKILKSNCLTKLVPPKFIPANHYGINKPIIDTYISKNHKFRFNNKWKIPKNEKLSSNYYKDNITYYHIKLPNYNTDFLIVNGIVMEAWDGKLPTQKFTLVKK